VADRRQVTLERTYPAAELDDVWELWTTKAGLESWWGPDGFVVVVKTLELRPGGVLEYTMTATGPQQIAFLEREGRPLSTEAKATYTEVVPRQRLAYQHAVDFVPGVQAYQVTHLVELHPTGAGVRLVLTFDAMHDERMTRLATMGWTNELEKLAAALAARA
jgi:uncharacterized protein YndB with AHSA1/START domain